MAAALVAVIGAVGTGVYIATTAQPVPGFVEVEPTHLFPEARDRAAAVETVEIAAADRTLTLRRDGDRWRLMEWNGYPADRAAVDGLVHELLGLRSAYVSETDPPPYADYGVTEDLRAEGVAPVRITLLNGGEPMARLIVGDTSRDPAGTTREKSYVRRAGGKRVWIADAAMRVSTDPDDWLRREVVDLDRSRVVSLDLQVDRRDGVAAERDETGRIRLRSGSISDTGIEGPWILEAVAGALEKVAFEDVRQVPDDADGDDAFGHLRMATAAGVVYDVALFRRESGLWADFRAHAVAAATTAAGPAREAEAFNRRHDGWRYRLPDHTVKILTTPPEELGRTSP